MLVINPDECIDCGVCEPECPVDAIISDFQDPDKKWYNINYEFSNTWPNTTEKIDALPEAEEFKGVSNKYEKYFSKEPAK
jgi:ferredoxin